MLQEMIKVLREFEHYDRGGQSDEKDKCRRFCQYVQRRRMVLDALCQCAASAGSDNQIRNEEEASAVALAGKAVSFYFKQSRRDFKIS